MTIYDMSRKELNNLLSVLAQHLDQEILAPNGNNMKLVEIYSNGNVACIPLNCDDYYEELLEFHADSIQLIKN